MHITKFETFPTRVPYRHKEVSARVNRGGIADTIVKLTTDDGLTGWGECTRAADASGIGSALKAMAPLVLGRDPWDRETIRRDVFQGGLWSLQAMTGNFAFAGIDMALWDLCGKACGQPIYNLLGGALRDEVDYMFYLERGDGDAISRQAAEGLSRGYSVFYLKVGVDARAEAEMLAALRAAIGPELKIRIDANEGWTLPEAKRLLVNWHAAFDLDFAEAPVSIDPIENFEALRQPGMPPLSVNEGLWRQADAYRIIKSRCASYLCYSPYWVGSMSIFHTLNCMAHLDGWLVCKHTHGELGLAAAAGQHLMLAAPNTAAGNQQTAQMMSGDILTEPLPIASDPKWGRIDKPGLGVEVDEDKLLVYHEAYLRDGEFAPYGDKFAN